MAIETPTPKRGRGRPRKDGTTPQPAQSSTPKSTRSVTEAYQRSLRPRDSAISYATTRKPPQQGSPSATRTTSKAAVVDGRITKRGRGRPRKYPSALGAAKAKTAIAVPKPGQKRRGRPPKSTAAATPVSATMRRGRPPKFTNAAPPASATKRRGRPPAAASDKTVSLDPVGIPYETWDVFTTDRFAGNPLAVVHLPKASSLTQQQKQIIAKEFNYSETTFVLPQGTAKASVDIFTTSAELPFAGHPTIGSICALASANPKLEKGELKIKAGTVPFSATRDKDGIVTASAEIPHNIHSHTKGFHDGLFKTLQPEAWSKSFGGEAPLAQDPWPLVSITKGMTFALLEVDTMEALGSIQASHTEITARVELDEEFSPSFVGCYFYYMASREANGAKQKVHSRMIEEDEGEDAVTGSAASALAAYLAMELFKTSDLREAEFEITQGEHFGRSGTPRLQVFGDADGKVEKMILSGEAKRVMRGHLEY